jgi:hypothetical protein
VVDGPNQDSSGDMVDARPAAASTDFFDDPVVKLANTPALQAGVS